MGNRRRARELVVQVLFHLEFSREDPEKAFDLLCDNFRVRKSLRVFSKDLVLGICERMKELDTLIQQASIHWRVERMPLVDRSILRLAVYEMIFRKDIPPTVSIDEAVEMGKRFGSEHSASFINGVLDRVYKDVTQDSPDLDIEEPTGANHSFQE
jgi:transcription antitermination factor NusB